MTGRCMPTGSTSGQPTSRLEGINERPFIGIPEADMASCYACHGPYGEGGCACDGKFFKIDFWGSAVMLEAISSRTLLLVGCYIATVSFTSTASLAADAE